MSPEPANRLQAMQSALYRVLRALVFNVELPAQLLELPVGQLRCLHTVAAHDGLRMQELADHMGIKLPAVSQMVDRLVRRGLVERIEDASDRRVVRVTTTSASRQLMAEHQARRLSRLRETVDYMTPGAVNRAICGLTDLARAAEQSVRGGLPTSSSTDNPLDLLSRRPPVLVEASPLSAQPATSTNSNYDQDSSCTTQER